MTESDQENVPSFPVPDPAVPDPEPQVDPVAPAPQPEPEPVADPPAEPQPPVGPIRVDNRTKRTDDDGLEGQFVKIVAGDYEGRVGAFERVLQSGEDGYPTQIAVRTRDAENELLAVAYADVRPATPYSGGR